jgi:glutamyl-tRNA synthetase
MGFPVFPLFWPYGETARGFREDGYYPEAFINMLALLGWNPGTEKEIFSMEELIDTFSIERVHKSGSRFDPEKAKWFNHTYLQNRTNNQLALEFREELRAHGHHIDINELETLVSLVRERVSFVKDIWDQTDFFFIAPKSFDQEVIHKRWKEDSSAVLIELKSVLEIIEDFNSASAETIVKEWIEKKGYNLGNVMNALRLVVVGALRGPHIFDIITWIGREETLRRIDKGIEIIGKIKE